MLVNVKKVFFKRVKVLHKGEETFFLGLLTDVFPIHFTSCKCFKIYGNFQFLNVCECTWRYVVKAWKMFNFGFTKMQIYLTR